MARLYHNTMNEKRYLNTILNENQDINYGIGRLFFHADSL